MGLVGAFALHIQCPWRLEQTHLILTGSDDFFSRANKNTDPTWEAGMVWGHLQNEVLQNILLGFDSQTNSTVNATNQFDVTTIVPDAFGGFALNMSGDYRLVSFPTGSRGEHWRLVRPDTQEKHFVVAGGRAQHE
jgi:hypothetical protein